MRHRVRSHRARLERSAARSRSRGTALHEQAASCHREPPGRVRGGGGAVRLRLSAKCITSIIGPRAARPMSKTGCCSAGSITCICTTGAIASSGSTANATKTASSGCPLRHPTRSRRPSNSDSGQRRISTRRRVATQRRFPRVRWLPIRRRSSVLEVPGRPNRPATTSSGSSARIRRAGAHRVEPGAPKRMPERAAPIRRDHRSRVPRWAASESAAARPTPKRI
jgi:hypothetical protein